MKDNLIRKSIKLSSGTDANEFFVDAIDSFHNHYEQIAHNSLPYDGVMETINFLKTKGLKLACMGNMQ